MSSPNVTIVPTLARMAAIYRLPREGGPASPRFAAYRAIAPEWGLSPWNPMAGAHALASVVALQAVDAEGVAREAARDAARELDHTAPVVLAVVVLSPGLWTDRLASDVERTLAPARVAGHGLVVTWAGEPVDANDVVRLARAEVARIVWTAHHGVADTAWQVLEREGFARAHGDRRPSAQEPPLGAVAAVMRTRGEARGLDGIAPIAFGDAVAEHLGWTPHCLPAEAGLHWATAHARAHVRAHGAERAVRMSGWLRASAEHG
jgi:hypothetical protein